MSATRADFEAIAGAFAKTYAACPRTDAAVFAIDAALLNVADALAGANARFDRSRFIAAARPKGPRA